MVCWLGSTNPENLFYCWAVLGKEWVPASLWSYLLHLHLVMVRISSTTEVSAATWQSMARCIGCTLHTVPDLRISGHVHQQALRPNLPY